MVFINMQFRLNKSKYHGSLDLNTPTFSNYSGCWENTLFWGWSALLCRKSIMFWVDYVVFVPVCITWLKRGCECVHIWIWICHICLRSCLVSDYWSLIRNNVVVDNVDNRFSAIIGDAVGQVTGVVYSSSIACVTQWSINQYAPKQINRQWQSLNFWKIHTSVG
jgi:hypothetical protein